MNDNSSRLEFGARYSFSAAVGAAIGVTVGIIGGLILRQYALSGAVPIFAMLGFIAGAGIGPAITAGVRYYVLGRTMLANDERQLRYLARHFSDDRRFEFSERIEKISEILGAILSFAAVVAASVVVFRDSSGEMRTFLLGVTTIFAFAIPILALVGVVLVERWLTRRTLMRWLQEAGETGEMSSLRRRDD